MKKKEQTGLLEIIIITLLKGLWFLVSWPVKKLLKLDVKKSKIDRVRNLAKWAQIEQMLETGDDIHAKHAIVEADKFFDDVMKQLGGRGETFADRLRSLESKMDHSKYQNVWNSHKIRNQISHEMDHKLSSHDAKLILDNYRAGLYNLGAI
jgi:hypothetical protein